MPRRHSPRAALFALGTLVCATALPACGPDPILTPPHTDQETGGDTYVPWWLGDRDHGDSFVPSGDLAGGDWLPQPGDQDQQAPLATRVLGRWSGEVPWSNNTQTRVLGVSFEAPDKLTLTINPWGPARAEHPGTFSAQGNSQLTLSAPTLQAQPLVWTEVVVAGNQLRYTDAQQNEITLTWGILPPSQGLVAQLLTYTSSEAGEIETTSWGRFQYQGLLSFVHTLDPAPACTDWVYGVSSLRLTGGTDVGVGAIPGFERHGGTRCAGADRFAVMWVGQLSLPAGLSGLRFNVETRDDVDDAGLAFVGDGVLEAINADPAVLCSAELGWLNPECYKHGGAYIGGETVTLDAGPTGGTFEFEVVYLEATGEVYLNVELDLGNDGTWAPLPLNLLAPLPDWEPG